VTAPDRVLPDPLGAAANWLGQGGLLAYPTETVWGLAADAMSTQSLARLQQWKGRGPGDPISVLVSGADAASELGFELDSRAALLAERFWPGPLTLVVRSQLSLAPGIAREDGAVGLRCSSHPLAVALARRVVQAGIGPITATSLNRSGSEPARTRQDALSLCHVGEDASQAPEQPRVIAVEGAEAGGDEASSVVDLSGAEPRVLRWGAISEEDLAPVLREIGAS